ncbi:PREDICTED: origin recognition complex subunit 6 [Nicrophorus vespilloides]|uniref:Origin recognition complex subunit 6 n=1 Tax=Nicrophorus vespilloides TaxID=110193 RepID=A0ABM1MAG3_NICVS|nr:PREDICTED: origin recognition complex subunit 6 [Nicrophorus vespilloides]
MKLKENSSNITRMSSTDNKILTNVSERLGLQDEIPIIKKAEEFLRMYQNKGGIQNLNDSAKAVFCLDLAASLLGIGFDKETAIKLSGLKKTAYQNKLHMVEKVLELDKPLTIGEVCVQFSCTVVKELAEKIYEKYKNQGIQSDLDHPQYVAVSVFTACKLKSFKIQKSQLVSISRLKLSQWKELESEFAKFVEKVGFTANIGGKKRKGANEFHTYLEEFAKNDENKVSKSPKKCEKIEEYSVWKERILEQARAALET